MFKYVLIGVFVSGCLAFPVEKELLPINPDVISDPKPIEKIIPITDPKEIEKIKREIPEPTEKTTQLRQDFFPVNVNIPSYPLQQQAPVAASLKSKRNVQEEHKEALPVPSILSHEGHKETPLKQQQNEHKEVVPVVSTLPLHPVQGPERKEDVKRDIPVPLEPKHKHEHHHDAEESEHVHHHEHNEDEKEHTSTSHEEQHVQRTRPIPVAELFGRKHE
ncbi:hypothetical protein ACFFRR_000901 [Megaselia abdita]